jgi:hypothetical protein
MPPPEKNDARGDVPGAGYLDKVQDCNSSDTPAPHPGQIVDKYGGSSMSRAENETLNVRNFVIEEIELQTEPIPFEEDERMYRRMLDLKAEQARRKAA